MSAKGRKGTKMIDRAIIVMILITLAFINSHLQGIEKRMDTIIKIIQVEKTKETKWLK